MKLQRAAASLEARPSIERVDGRHGGTSSKEFIVPQGANEEPGSKVHEEGRSKRRRDVSVLVERCGVSTGWTRADPLADRPCWLGFAGAPAQEIVHASAGEIGLSGFDERVALVQLSEIPSASFDKGNASRADVPALAVDENAALHSNLRERLSDGRRGCAFEVIRNPRRELRAAYDNAVSICTAGRIRTPNRPSTPTDDWRSVLAQEELKRSAARCSLARAHRRERRRTGPPHPEADLKPAWRQILRAGDRGRQHAARHHTAPRPSAHFGTT